jgi:3-dehydroquinate synthase
MMRTLDVRLGARSYPIYIGTGLFERLAELMRAAEASSIAIVTNDVLQKLWLPAVLSSLESAGVRATTIVVPDGEARKTLDTWSHIQDRLLGARLDRKSMIVALGGGVVGDLAGFAAATYQRGIALAQVPTTLLSQVDSSVGGKTGVNHPAGKNMIGAFYQPKVVVIDTATLSTLPDRELSAGLAEVIKYGLIRDRAFFEWLEANVDALLARDPAALSYAIETSCRHKAEVVANDETEQGERALLNFGHTFGHAIEAALGYGEWLHGEAVAAGMVLAVRTSAARGWMSAGDVSRVERLLVRARLPVTAPALGTARWLELMAHDKKAVAGRITLILLHTIGQGAVDNETRRATLARIMP